MKATPKITVRIDRGEDWVEISGDAFGKEDPPICGSGNLEDWLDYDALRDAWLTLDGAVMK